MSDLYAANERPLSAEKGAAWKRGREPIARSMRVAACGDSFLTPFPREAPWPLGRRAKPITEVLADHDA